MLKYQLFFTAERGRIELVLYLSFNCCHVTSSQHLSVGELPDFSFTVKLGHTQGECTCHRSLLFLNWSSLTLAKRDSWWACVPTQPTLWVFPSILGKQSWNLSPALALDLVFIVMNKLIILQNHPGHPSFLPSTTQREKFLAA